MKVWTFMAIIVTMLIFLNFVGYTVPSGTDLLNDTGVYVEHSNGTLMISDSSNNWSNGLFDKSDGWIFLLSAAGVILVGAFTRTFEIKLAFIPFFTTFGVKFVRVGFGIVNLAAQEGQGWLVAIVATIFLPITIMFIFSIIEWFGGSPSD